MLPDAVGQTCTAGSCVLLLCVLLFVVCPLMSGTVRSSDTLACAAVRAFSKYGTEDVSFISGCICCDSKVCSIQAGKRGKSRAGPAGGQGKQAGNGKPSGMASSNDRAVGKDQTARAGLTVHQFFDNLIRLLALDLGFLLLLNITRFSRQIGRSGR